MNELDSLRCAGTPEELFIINPKAPRELHTDAVMCAISRAQVIVELIESNGNEQEYFHISHKHIINALWQLEATLGQIKQMVRYSYSKADGGKP